MTKKILSKSASFGLQNFFFVNSYIGSSETGDTNEYVVFMDSKGLIRIACYNAAGDEGRYVDKAGVYASIVAARGTYTYALPNEIKEIISESER